MGSKQSTLRGRVIGHTVKYLPQQQSDRGGGITIVKQPKIGAFVTVQVDDKKVYTVPCRSSERLLNNGEEPTEDMHHEVNNHLVQCHPFRAEREFVEHVTSRSKGSALRRYELQEEKQ
jgi:hypothetical protein